MNIQEIIKAIQRFLLIVGSILALSLIMGVIGAITGIFPFGAGFVLTAIAGGAIYWLVRNDEL